MPQQIATLGIVAAGAVVLVNVAIGAAYVRDCRASGGTVAECWDRGLAISGLGSGGPLAAALGIGGYALGRRNGWDEGYQTWNPTLSQPDPTDPPTDHR